MTRLIRALACLVLLAGPMPALAACPPPGHDRAALEALKAAGFRLDDATARQALALDLVDCLGAPDPMLRDGIAYEGLTTWLRADALDAGTRQALLDRLLSRLAPCTADPAGFEAPFAALALSEVARTDRVAPWLTPEARASQVDAAADYLEGISDRRGFIDGQGWRHGVAHGADWLMQLALNPALEPASLTRILDAVATQVAPVAAPAYIHGESERLVRPVVFVLQRGLVDDAAWAAWVQRVASAAPMAAWSEAYGSEAGLARRHNTRVFLLALYAALRESGDQALQAKVPAVVAGLRALD